MNMDPRLLRNLDKWLILILICIIGIGLAATLSATKAGFPRDWEKMMFTQAAAVVVGLAAIAVILVFDYGEFSRLSKTLYVLNLVLLAVVLVLGRGKEEWGSNSWLTVGGFSLQPSEIVKVFLIINLATYLDRQERLSSWWDLAKAAFYFAPPLLLVLAQPDIGTALVLIVTFFAMLYMAGAPGWKLALVGGGGLGLVVLLVYMQKSMGINLHLPEHAIDRLLVFINPEGDLNDAGYNLYQSRIAIGSGGLFGAGLFRGSQNNLNFLPEQHSDFIFAVVGEELGFIGAATLILLFTFLLWRIVAASMQAKDRYGALLTTGVAAMIGFHVLENAGMSMGIMPITGIPLPFVSHGGTSMMAYLMAMGLVLNVGMRRQTIMF